MLVQFTNVFGSQLIASFSIYLIIRFQPSSLSWRLLLLCKFDRKLSMHCLDSCDTTLLALKLSESLMQTVGQSFVMHCKVSPSPKARLASLFWWPSHTDPDISVRRKTAFLLSTLLIPEGHIASSSQTQMPAQEPLRITYNPNRTNTSSNTAVVPHPSPSVPDAAPVPIHANSHASHLRNPESTATSQLTVQGIRAHGILDAVISAVKDPLPHGEDGDDLDADPDFEEKAVRLIFVLPTARRLY